MNYRTTMLLVAAIATGCSTSQPADTETKAMQAPPEQAEQTTDATALIAAANENFVTSFQNGQMSDAVAHYADAGAWYLTNGMSLAGRDAIAGALDKARADGAGNFVLTDRTVTSVEGAVYTTESFAFDLAPGKNVTGVRYGLWRTTGDKPKLEVDVWVPAAPADGQLRAAITERTAALASAYNSPDAATLQSMYGAGARQVLSNGTLIGADALPKALADTAAMGINDMRFGDNEVFSVSPDAAYARGSFAVTLPLPNGQVPIAGERLMLWQRDESGAWRVGMELSWPAPAADKSASTQTELGGMSFAWQFVDGKLRGVAHAPASGWLAVGFNTEQALGGSRLVMARVQDDAAVAEEHFADPPQHFDIRTRGERETVRIIRSTQDSNGTLVEFELDARPAQPSGFGLAPGQNVWLTLAYSDHDDFTHHSRFRSAKSVRL